MRYIFFGKWAIDKEKRKMYYMCKEVFIEPDLYDMLLHLAERRGQYVKPKEFIEAMPDLIKSERAALNRIRDIRDSLFNEGQTYIKSSNQGCMLI